MTVDLHIRSQVKAAFAAALARVEAFGGRVYQSRSFPLSAEDLPCAVVAVEAETVETRQTGRQRLQARRMNVSVSILAKGGEDVEAALDALSVSVERAVFEDLSAGFAKNLELTATDTTLNADAAFVVGQHRLLFGVDIATLEGAPERRA